MPMQAKINPATRGAELAVTKLIPANRVTTAQIDVIIAAQSPVVI